MGGAIKNPRRYLLSWVRSPNAESAHPLGHVSLISRSAVQSKAASGCQRGIVFSRSLVQYKPATRNTLTVAASYARRSQMSGQDIAAIATLAVSQRGRTATQNSQHVRGRLLGRSTVKKVEVSRPWRGLILHRPR